MANIICDNTSKIDSTCKSFLSMKATATRLRAERAREYCLPRQNRLKLREAQAHPMPRAMLLAACPLLQRDDPRPRGPGSRAEAYTMDASTKPDKPDPAQSEIGRGTPPTRTPEDLPDTDLQPEQAPVRDTPDVQQPRNPLSQ